MPTELLTLGIDHVGLTVQDLRETHAFFTECLGWQQIGERPEYPAVFVSDGSVMVTLWQSDRNAPTIPFDRKRNVGLHHLALRVRSEDALHETYLRVTNWPGAKVEFAPELLGAGPKLHMMVQEPGGIRIEFAFDPRTAIKS